MASLHTGSARTCQHDTDPERNLQKMVSRANTIDITGAKISGIRKGRARGFRSV
jgi:hypothetical protein